MWLRDLFKRKGPPPLLRLNVFENLALKRQRRNHKIRELQAAIQEVVAAEKEVRQWQDSRRL